MEKRFEDLPIQFLNYRILSKEHYNGSKIYKIQELVPIISFLPLLHIWRDITYGTSGTPRAFITLEEAQRYRDELVNQDVNEEKQRQAKWKVVD